jgi:adenylosuccinate synthase
MNIKQGRNVVVVGTQWGDEGKGKLVDWLTTAWCVFRVVTMRAIPW